MTLISIYCSLCHVAFAALHIFTIVGTVVGMLTALMGSSACFYHLNTSSKNSYVLLEEKRKELKNILDNIKEKFNKGGVLRPDPSKWIDEADKLLVQIIDMNLGTRLHENCANINVCSLCGTWKLIEKKLGEIEKLLTEGKEFKVIGFKKSLENKNIMGGEMEELRKNIWEDVSQPNNGVQVVCIHGMAGVGKTSMASAIHDLALDSMTYLDNVIWVDFKHQLVIKNIQEEILSQLTDVKFSDSENDESRANTLKGALTKKKFLMVLVNLPMRQEVQLDDIGFPLLGDNWKLLVTSISHSACTKVEKSFIGRSKTYGIPLLSDEEAWKLFVGVAGSNGEQLVGEIYDSTKRAINDLDGLPLPIEKLAEALKHIPDYPNGISGALSDELDALCSSSSLLGNKSKKFFNDIEMIFKSLEGDVLECLFYSLLLPKGYLIKEKELIEYWMWEGLLGEVSSLEETMGKGRDVLTKLVDVHLLKRNHEENGQLEKSVEMLYAVRLVAMDVVNSRNKNYFIKCGKSLKELPLAKDWPANTQKASFVENEVRALKNRPDCRKLSTLLLQKNPLDSSKPCKNFFSYMVKLRVLDLSHTNIPSLPKSLFDLEKLRALLLRNCSNLTSLQSLSNLKNLLVIDLSGTPLKKFPKGLKHLTKLRRLDLSNTSLRVFRSEEFRNLRNIEELLLISNQETGEPVWGSNIISPVLRRHCIEDLVNLRKLVVLQLNFLNSEVFTNFLDASRFSGNGKKFKFCVGVCNIDGGRAIHDNSLIIMNDGQLDTPPSLERYGCFKGLAMLHVSDCDELEYLLTQEMLSMLEKLKHIQVKRCKNIVSIIKKEDRANIVDASTLTTLVLCDMPKLQSICDCQVLKCPNINLIEVSKCRILKLPQEIHGGEHRVVLKGDETNWLEKVMRNHSTTYSSTFEIEEILH